MTEEIDKGFTRVNVVLGGKEGGEEAKVNLELRRILNIIERLRHMSLNWKEATVECEELMEDVCSETEIASFLDASSRLDTNTEVGMEQVEASESGVKAAGTNEADVRSGPDTNAEVGMEQAEAGKSNTNTTPEVDASSRSDTDTEVGMEQAEAGKRITNTTTDADASSRPEVGMEQAEAGKVNINTTTKAGAEEQEDKNFMKYRCFKCTGGFDARKDLTDHIRRAHPTIGKKERGKRVSEETKDRERRCGLTRKLVSANKRRRPTATDDDLTPNKNENKRVDLSESTRKLKAKESEEAEEPAQGTREEVERKGEHDQETQGKTEGRRDEEEPATPGSPEGAGNL